MSEMDSKKKIEWLTEQKLWPPVNERLYGSLIYKTKIVKDAVNQKTGENVTCERSVFKLVTGKELLEYINRE